MPPLNGAPVPINPLEFKPSGCPCGHNEFDIDRFASFHVHRFRADMVGTQINERYSCRACGWIRGTPFTGVPKALDD